MGPHWACPYIIFFLELFHSVHQYSGNTAEVTDNTRTLIGFHAGGLLNTFFRLLPNVYVHVHVYCMCYVHVLVSTMCTHYFMYMYMYMYIHSLVLCTHTCNVHVHVRVHVVGY